jgi:predicted dehydrogenase
VDSDVNKLKKLKDLYPNLAVSTSPEDIFKSTEIEAVVIATPVFSHFPLAQAAILSGKHVLVEKPMTSSLKDAEILLELADKKGKILMPDHTFLYTGAVEKMKEMVSSGNIGQISYIDSTRINLGLFQPDVNVLWDLAAHDISICDYLIGEKPYSVQATGISHTQNGIENIAYLTLNYQSNIIAHFNCSWTSPVKIRQMLVGGDKKMIVYNDMEPTEKLKIYDTGYTVKSDEDRTQILVDYRVGDIYTPKLAGHEALGYMASDFIQASLSGKPPISNALIGLTVVKVLEAAERSLKSNGKEIILV